MTTAQSITELTALTTPAGADLLCIVDDVGGAAEETKRITVANLFGKIPAQLVCIGDDANANMTVGLTINQGANDDEILTLKSSDVAHGVTTKAETDTYVALSKISATDGGLDILALADTGSLGFRIRAIVPTDNTTKSTAGVAYISLYAQKISGTATTTPGADANLLALMSGTTTRFIFDAEGEMHSDAIIGVGDDWDEWDDLALAADLSRLPKAKFDEMMKYKAEDFERAGLLTLSTDEDGTRHAFIRHKAMLQFAMCCFAEVAQRMKRYEHALLSVGVSPKLLEA